MISKRKILIGAVIVVGLVLTPGVIRYFSNLPVEAYQKQLAARGEKLTIAELAPPFTAEEQKQAHDLMSAIALLKLAPSNSPPALRTIVPGHLLVGWAEENLPTEDSTNVWPGFSAQVSAHAESLAALRAVLKKPVGGTNLDYRQDFMLQLPHHATIIQATVWLSTASILDLHEGHPREAWENINSCLKLNRTFEREPLVISQFVRTAINNIALNATAAALQYPNWQDNQLAEMQAAWESVDPLNELESSLGMERAMLQLSIANARISRIYFYPSSGNQTVMDCLGQLMENPKEGYENFMNRYPRYWAWKSYWSYQEELYTMQLSQCGIEAVRSFQTNGAFVPVLKQLNADLVKLSKEHLDVSKHFELFADGHYAQDCLRKIGLMEMERRLLITAIALQRSKLAHGKYPEELKELVPAYFAQVPLDPMDGKPLRYRPNLDGSFLLYSVGEDGWDDGGDPSPNRTINSEYMSWTTGRDAVWPTPATAEEVKSYKEKMIAAWNAKHKAGLATRSFVGRMHLPIAPPPTTQTN